MCISVYFVTILSYVTALVESLASVVSLAGMTIIIHILGPKCVCLVTCRSFITCPNKMSVTVYTCKWWGPTCHLVMKLFFIVLSQISFAMACYHVIFSAHVQLFFKPNNSAVGGNFREENHTVFTRLNEAYLFGSKDGNIRYALCLMYQCYWCCSNWQNARDNNQYLWTNWKVYMCTCFCWQSFKFFIGLQKDLFWVPVSLLYLSFCLSNLWHSELQHVVRWMLLNLYASVIVNNCEKY